MSVNDKMDESENEMETDSGGETCSEAQDGSVKIYLPGQALNNDEELVCDESTYVLYHQAQTGAPCLSFDVIQDDLGENRAEKFPLTAYIVAGSQAERSHVNNLIVIKLSNMNKVKATEEDESDSDTDDEDENPELECALIHHHGCVNRVRVTAINNHPFAASWSEMGKVYIWDLSHPLQAVNVPHVMASYVRNNEAPKPVFTFTGHQSEGFAVDWSPTKPGVLATGDCKKNIHLWKPLEGGTWHVDQRAYTGHTASVEDLQWSPNEPYVLASCSVDKSIRRVWDMRAAPQKACMITTEDAHELDINVISWNHKEPFILSGGDDGIIKIWDLRQFKKEGAIAMFKHHTAPITSVEWHPTDSTVYAASGSDDQISLWDMAVERDSETETTTQKEAELANLPPQLLFIHQGQTEIKELHWHPQMPGVIISTALSGFNIFRTISV
ncbi:WD repeat-containing protein 1 l(2)09851 isoform X1 [Tachypleus tridentatus]|uniref:WD repeat-containing protein 1 l(2)09851 isoform X1 n=1 Tax=Tachypleus tridentatus TaxID=6853 RepID=UPI003FCFBD83